MTTWPLTSFQQQASAVAYTEADSLRWAYDMWDASCKKAIKFNQEGRHGRAHFELVKTGLKVAKAVRDLESVDELSQLRLFEPFRPTNV